MDYTLQRKKYIFAVNTAGKYQLYAESNWKTNSSTSKEQICA